MNTTRPQPAHQRPRNLLVLGPKDDAILRVVIRYHLVTSRQVTRLLYAAGSLTYVQAKLKALTEADFLQKVFLPKTTQAGSAPSVYTLSRRGMQRLAEVGVDIPLRARPYKTREYTYLHLNHVLAVNEVLIAAELLCGLYPQVQLARLIHDRDLQRQPVRVDDGVGGSVSVIPDGYLDFHVTTPQGRFQTAVCLELDRGSENIRAFRRKVRALCVFAGTPYQQTFGTDVLTIAVIATPGSKRLQDLIAWTEDELTELGRAHDADLFRFSTADLTAITPTELFLQPRWYQPFARQPEPLLAGL